MKCSIDFRNPNLVFTVLAVVLVCVTVFMYFHPGIFPMSGFSGPEGYVVSPANARLTGDSWRYISGGHALLHGGELGEGQRSYLGYCLLYGLSGRYFIALHMAFALAALAALFHIGMRLGGRCCAILAGVLFALNPEFAAWHCAIMTESIYTSCVCINAFLALWAMDRGRTWRIPVVFAWVVLTAFIRPTGWIQVPAVLLLWCFALVPRLPWKISCAALIAFGYVLCSMLFAENGIQRESPTLKLYSGEVVWQEELWRVNMPEADFSKSSLADGVLYGLRHPIASGWLAFKRICVMFLRIRPSYSKAHNLFLLAYHLPIALLGLLGLLLKRRLPQAWAITAMLAAHALVVALTFNDNDGRFTLYFTPLLSVAACAALTHFIDAFIRRPMPQSEN